MDILFWRPSKRRRRNFCDSDSDDYLDFLEGSDGLVDDMDQDSDSDSSADVGPEGKGQRSLVSTPELQPLNVQSLVDSAAKIVAKNVSCAEIESHNPPLDESMLKKIAFWAFPQDESHVKVFSKLTLTAPYEWNSGERRVTDGLIKKIRQVGFMVSAFVETARDKQDVKVSLTFEKQRLTSTSCSACRDVVFCLHIIAVVLERIRHADKVPVHAPMTETLSTLSRDQLQKLLQYAINEDPGGVLGRVFQHIDELRDVNSEYNLLQGAPDPTFGMLPDEKSTWEVSLEKLKTKLVTDLGDGFNSYRDTCDLFFKLKTGFYDRYFRRVHDLISKDEIEAAGQVLITIAETTYKVSNFRWSNSTKRVFLDVERMISCFIASFTGEIRQEMVNTALTINKSINSNVSGPIFLEPKRWAEMVSIKLHNIGKDNLALVEAMGGHEGTPFYEPLMASQLPEIPVELQKVFNKETSILESEYDEPLDVMLFRFECLVQYHQWTEDDSCQAKICALGSLILKKSILLSENLSILTFDEKMSRIMEDLQKKQSEDKEIEERDTCEPSPAKRSRRVKGNSAKEKNRLFSKRLKDAAEEVKNEMQRATDDKTFDGLSQAQLCYSLLYVCYKLCSLEFQHDSSERDILAEATLRVFELSRFRYSEPMEVNEVSWWEQLLDRIMNHQPFIPTDAMNETARKYCQALLRSKLDFYGDYLPLPLIDLLQAQEIPYIDKLNLAVDVLCYSQKPAYQFNFVSVAQDYRSESEKKQLRGGVIRKYKALLSHVFAFRNFPEQSEAARQVLCHLESVQDGEYVVTAFNCIKSNVVNMVEKEDKLVLLTVLLNCIKECVVHDGKNGLYSYSTSVSDTLLFLSKSLSEDFPRRVLPLWTEMCKYFSKDQIKSLVAVIKGAVKEKPSLIQDMAATVQKYFTSSFNHDLECCSFLKIFFPDDTKRHQMLKKIASNAAHYTTGALLRIGKAEYKKMSETDPSINVFCKHVYSFFVLGLKPLKDKDTAFSNHSGYGPASLRLSSKELKYLKWYFGMLAASMNKDIIKYEQFKKLMALLKEVLKRDVNLMIYFYQAMEVSVIGFKETKAQLGKELVSCYLRKFQIELRNCNHTHYGKVLEEMKVARLECEQYVPNGSNEFGDTVISCVRRMFKGKRKLVQLMDESFPDHIPAKKPDKKAKK